MDTKEQKSPKPQAGTWNTLQTGTAIRPERIKFEVNIPVEFVCDVDEPQEIQGEESVFYVFDGKVGTEHRQIATSAWTLLHGLKAFAPLKDKTFIITKKLMKGKQSFDVALKV